MLFNSSFSPSSAFPEVQNLELNAGSRQGSPCLRSVRKAEVALSLPVLQSPLHPALHAAPG